MENNRLDFIVKTNYGCNMRCAYCYEGDRLNGSVMSQETINALLSKAGEYAVNKGSSVNFIWHGGEPLLVGKGFYERVVERQKSFGPDFKYSNVLQTNGVLLDKEFAQFFVDNDFMVGISLDGPPKIHDAQRFGSRPDTGTFKQVFSAFVEMDSLGKRPGALAVFTRNTLENLDEFYEFFRDCGLSVKINPLTYNGRAKDSTAEHLSVTPKEYGEALVYLFDRWIKEPEYNFSIDPLTIMVRSLVSGNTYNCTQSGRCFNYFKVFADGAVYLCGRKPYENHVLGDIKKDDLASIVNSPEREQYSQIKAAVKELCSPCKYFDICNGGCTDSAYSRYQTMPARDYYCESFRTIFDHMDKIVPRHIELCRAVPSVQSFDCV